MKALDTNVIVRFLIQDDEIQATIVHRRLKEAEQNKEVLLVPLLVLLETIWVLETVYQVARADVLDTISELLMLPTLELELQPMVRRFVETARQSSTDLSDALIGHCARESGCKVVLTFDKKAARSDFFERLVK